MYIWKNHEKPMKTLGFVDENYIQFPSLSYNASRS